MRLPLIASFSLWMWHIRAQDVFEFELADFNVAGALEKNGIDLSNTPRESEQGSNALCLTLSLLFGSAKVQPQNSSAYTSAINSFWSARQQEAQPSCIFNPSTPQDISTFILFSRLFEAPFAVRSGGHAAFQGASNINNGVTLTFSNMKNISLSDNMKTVHVQPGNTWSDVYAFLSPRNLSVVGGRVSGIGVGGLTLGGGISFFSNEYGWACDNVASYQVVLASGQIVTASPGQHENLYWALRGGGSNFGIVTSFEMATFGHGNMFGGQRVFLEPSFPAATDAFLQLASDQDADPKAAQYLAIALDVSSNTRIAVAELTYADPDPEPAVFAPYRAIPALSDSGRITTLANLTSELNASNPNGFRETYWTASSRLSASMVQFVVSTCFEEFETLRNVSGIVPANALQVITTAQLEQMQKNGGNALGLNPSSGPIMINNLNMRWDKEEDDELVLSVNRRIVEKVKEESRSRGEEVEYLYMNYASEEQDVIGSYGDVNRLQGVAAKYDPVRVFQRLMPGYFKLDGSPLKGGT